MYFLIKFIVKQCESLAFNFFFKKINLSLYAVTRDSSKLPKRKINLVTNFKILILLGKDGRGGVNDDDHVVGFVKKLS